MSFRLRKGSILPTQNQLTVHFDGGADSIAVYGPTTGYEFGMRGMRKKTDGVIGGYTVNECEFMSLICALTYTLRICGLTKIGSVNIHGDSQLIVRSMSKEWRIRDLKYLPYREDAYELVRQITGLGVEIDISWVSREDFNQKQADKTGRFG